MKRATLAGLLFLGWLIVASVYHFQQFAGPILRLLGRGD